MSIMRIERWRYTRLTYRTGNRLKAMGDRFKEKIYLILRVGVVCKQQAVI